MDERKDFTYDPEKFPVSKVRSLVEDLHQQHQQIVAIIDPGIKLERGYPPFETGVQRDVFIKNKNGRYAVGKVWPGYTVFPDFHSTETQLWWKSTIEDWLKQVPLDGKEKVYLGLSLSSYTNAKIILVICASFRLMD
jgi:alpha-glucosidase (family GH31 glycosyl hydrolase)